MGQDIREMFRHQEPNKDEKLKEGHAKRFEARLEKALPVQKRKEKRFFVLQIAAVLVVAFGIGGFFYFSNEGTITTPDNNQVVENNMNEELPAPTQNDQDQYRLSEVSPEFKRIEDYYLASLNIQLAKLELTPENKVLIDAFMNKLETLDEDYQALNAEIQETGINEETVEAMITNLQIRLDLLKKLKTKLNEIKQSKDNRNENFQA